MRRPTFRGHRQHSFYAIDEAELTELRARQRTFDGAYFRTALGNISYAVIVLKLYDKRFYRIGLLYTVLAALLFILSFMRGQHSNDDFSDLHRGDTADASGRRIFGRPFVTAGFIVAIVSMVYAIVEVGILALVITL